MPPVDKDSKCAPCLVANCLTCPGGKECAICAIDFQLDTATKLCVQKPFYKTVWFWFLMVVLTIVILVVVCCVVKKKGDNYGNGVEMGGSIHNK